MNQKLFKVMSLAAIAATFASCEKDEVKIGDTSVEISTEGAYVVSQGNWGENNGSLQFIDLINKRVSEDIFYKENDRMIGDLFQDICVYGTKLYCTVSESSKVMVLERSGKLVKEINLTDESGKPVSPRYITSYRGNLYFTAYDGYVHSMDTVAYELGNKVKVGDFPEALTVAEGKLFVNNSNHYLAQNEKNSVSVVDLATFENIRTIGVHLNPYDQSLTAADGNVYIVCCGNFGQNDPENGIEPLYSTLVKIDSKTYQTTNLTTASKIASRYDLMYIIYNDYYVANSLSYKTYDLSKNAVTNENFISSAELTDPNSIDVDPAFGNIYISKSTYGSLGEIYVYSSLFKIQTTYKVGYSPAKVAFAY